MLSGQVLNCKGIFTIYPFAIAKVSKLTFAKSDYPNELLAKA